MLDVAFALLAFAASLGAFLALLREGDALRAVAKALSRYGRGLGLIHGGLGGTGLLVLLAALYVGAIHPAAGVAGFDVIAAWLLGIAFIFGVSILTTLRAGRSPSALIAIHAALAISGVVVLMALVVLG